MNWNSYDHKNRKRKRKEDQKKKKKKLVRETTLRNKAYPYPRSPW